MHLSRTKQLGYAGIALLGAVVLSFAFTSLARADTATTTTGTTTTSYVFDADLTGANQVPPLTASTTNSASTTNTTGHSRVWFDITNASGTPATTTVMWTSLQLQNADNVFAAHLHCGLPGSNGPIVVNLFNVATTSAVSGSGMLVATSSITDANIVATTTGCSMPITNLAQLEQALIAGQIYANVHDNLHPMGVVRGQLTLSSQNSSSTSTSTPGSTGNNHCPVSNTANGNGYYDSNNIWHSCDTGGGNGGIGCGSVATSTNNQMGWYDNGGNWHSCQNNGGNGGNNACPVNASSTAGWYDNGGNWHFCNNGNGNGNGNGCTATSTGGFYDNSGMWHWCNNGNNGNNGGNNNNCFWFWCFPSGNGNNGGITMPTLPTMPTMPTLPTLPNTGVTMPTPPTPPTPPTLPSWFGSTTSNGNGNNGNNGNNGGGMGNGLFGNGMNSFFQNFRNNIEHMFNGMNS